MRVHRLVYAALDIPILQADNTGIDPRRSTDQRVSDLPANPARRERDHPVGASLATRQSDAASESRGTNDAELIGLVSAARRGERDALARLHQRFAPLVHAVLLTRVGRHDADDLTQDVFMQAMTKLHTLRDALAVGPWLATLARRAAADLHRRHHPHLQLTQGTDAPATNWRDIDRAQQADAALNAIRSLPEAYQETLVLRLVEGLTGPQIAACMGMTHGSVRVNLHHGMRMLREKLGLGQASDSEDAP